MYSMVFMITMLVESIDKTFMAGGWGYWVGCCGFDVWALLFVDMDVFEVSPILNEQQLVVP